MELTIANLIPLISMVVSFVFGAMAKKFNWMPSKYVPIQNLVIGVIATVVYCLVAGDINWMQALVTALSGLMAGGVYDLTQTKFGNDTTDKK